MTGATNDSQSPFPGLRERHLRKLAPFGPGDEGSDEEKGEHGENKHDIPRLSGAQGRVDRSVAKIESRDSEEG